MFHYFYILIYSTLLGLHTVLDERDYSLKGNKVVIFCIFSKFLGSAMSGGIYVENNVDFGNQENYRDVDFFMRLKTGIKNGGGRGPPTFYTDQVSKSAIQIMH